MNTGQYANRNAVFSLEKLPALTGRRIDRRLQRKTDHFDTIPERLRTTGHVEDLRFDNCRSQPLVKEIYYPAQTAKPLARTGRALPAATGPLPLPGPTRHVTCRQHNHAP